MPEDKEERFGNWGGFVKDKYELCKTCKNSNGPKPWANSPSKAYCIAYPREKGVMKPRDIMEGADCPYYI